MSNILTRFATGEPTGCAVCRRHAVALGYAPKQGQPLLWTCDNSDCHTVARKVYRMPQNQLDAFEVGAMIEAGNQAGAYLDEINNTDLATLDAEQYREFLRRIIVTFESTMRKRILDGCAPF